MSTPEGGIQWILYLLRDLKILHPTHATLFRVNISAIHIAKNAVFHERTKHLVIDCHFVRSKVQDNNIHLLLVNTKEQQADSFTKAMHSPAHKEKNSKAWITGCS